MVSEAILFPGFKKDSRKVEGSRVHYYVGGEGPGLILLHGLGGGGRELGSPSTVARLALPDPDPGSPWARAFRAGTSCC